MSELKATFVMPKLEVFEDFTGKPAAPKPVLDLPKFSFQFDHVEYPNEQGIKTYYKKCKYPQYTMPFPQAMYACDQAKRLLVGYVRVFSRPWMALGLLNRKNLNEAVRGYCEAANKVLRVPYPEVGWISLFYKRQYYCPIAKEVWTTLSYFLQRMGVEEVWAENAGKIAATFLEQDNVYRWRTEDLASATTKTALMRNFGQEIALLGRLYSERTPDAVQADKLLKLIKIARWANYVPKFRNILRKTLKNCDFSAFQWELGDWYFSRMQSDYNFDGLGFESRREQFMEIHGHNEATYPQVYVA